MNELNRHDASRGRAVLEDDYEYIEVEEAAGLDYPGGVMMSPGVGMSDRTRWIITVALVAAALVCWFALLPHFSSPEAHADVIATIDEKIDNVLTLTAGSAGASALISAIPGDAGSPIAEKLMDLSTGFLIVLAALFLENTSSPYSARRPWGSPCLWRPSWAWPSFGCGAVALGKASLIVGGKLTALGVVLLLAIPTSTWVTNQIDATYETSMQERSRGPNNFLRAPRRLRKRAARRVTRASSMPSRVSSQAFSIRSARALAVWSMVPRMPSTSSLSRSRSCW